MYPQRSIFNGPSGLAAAVLLCATALGGCQGAISQHGYIPSQESLDRLKPGEQTRDEVATLLGTPSTVDPFADTTWVYVNRKTSTFAWFQPTVLEQNVLVVRFDDEGKLADVGQYTLKDGQAISPVSRTTPAQGKELSFMEQLVGNLGRFNNTPSRRGP